MQIVQPKHYGVRGDLSGWPATCQQWALDGKVESVYSISECARHSGTIVKMSDMALRLWTFRA